MNVKRELRIILSKYDLGLFVNERMLDEIVAAVSMDLASKRVYDHGQRETSTKAAEAERMRAGKFSQNAEKIIVRLGRSGPLSDEQLSKALRMNPNTVRPRRLALIEAGLVIDSGDRASTDSGSEAIQWTLTDAGAITSGLLEASSR